MHIQARERRTRAMEREPVRPSACVRSIDREESGSTSYVYDRAHPAGRVAVVPFACSYIPANVAPSLPSSLPPCAPPRSCLRSRAVRTTFHPISRLPNPKASLLAHFRLAPAQSCPSAMPAPLGNAIGKSFASQSLSRSRARGGKGGRTDGRHARRFPRNICSSKHEELSSRRQCPPTYPIARSVARDGRTRSSTKSVAPCTVREQS